MGRKVFVSYKYADKSVADLGIKEPFYVSGKIDFKSRNTIVRDYVDIIQKLIGVDNINLGERDGESLEEFADSTIESTLKKKIFQSSVTIVIISKGMKDIDKTEKEQWVPWEISYSLRTISRENQTSKMNAILGVVLPDETNSYDWYYRYNLDCNSTTHFTDQLFDMLKLNMFNVKAKTSKECNGSTIITNINHSFIKTVKWDEFNGDNYNFYLDKAIELRDDQLKNETFKMKIQLD